MRRATQKQITKIYLTSAELGFSKRELLMLTGGKKPEELDVRKASKLIEHLERLKRKEKVKNLETISPEWNI